MILPLFLALFASFPSAARPQSTFPDRAAVEAVLRGYEPVVIDVDGGVASGLRVRRSWEGDACRSTLVNEGEQPVRVREVRLFSWEHGLPGDTGLYGEALQMLSQTGGTLGEPVDLGYYTDRGHYKVSVPEGARAALYGMVMLRGEANRRLLLGFTTCRRFVGRFELREGRIDLVIETEGLTLEPGATWELEELALLEGCHRDDLLAAFGERIAKHHPRRTSGPPPSGWCSWYCFGPGVTTEDVRRNLEWIAESDLDLRYVQIDDGYQAAMGDWLATGAAFGGGVQRVLAEIEEAGFEPAIWVAPLIAERDSALFREHPDWFISGPDGTPLRSDTVSFGGWRHGPWYCLDGTHPGAQRHLRELFRTMREEWGCTYFKLDANFWGMMHGGRFHDPNATRVEAYRRGMEAILEGVGDAFVLGCNHPIWPSFGLIDGSRSSMDVSRDWSVIRRTGRENLLRNWQNGVLWWNDPDCLLVEARLPENELLYHASLLHATGGMLLSGDDLPRMSPAAVKRLAAVASPTGVPARFADETLGVGVMELEGERRVFLFNDEEEPHARSIRLDEPNRVVDFWSGEELGVLRGDLELPPLPPRSTRVLRCMPLIVEEVWPGAESEWHDFVRRHTGGSGDFFVLRDGLQRSREVFEREKRGRVAFLGGSITYNPGWRDLLCEELRRRFPGTDLDFVAAGIPSMGSTPGAFRLERDVLGRGRVDLLFVEAAVNDSTNTRTPVEMLRGMEGIVRHARRANPSCDVVLMHFVDPDKIAAFTRGEVPTVIVQHERVAEHYSLPSLDLALEVTARIQNGEFTWTDDFKNLHPSPFGQQLYFESMKRLLDAAWSEDAAPSAEAPELPEPLDRFAYDAGIVVDIDLAQLDEGWTRIERWHPTDGAGTRAGFADVPMLVSETPGATLRLPFEGRAVGVWVAAGPDAGHLDARVDDRAWHRVDLWLPWSRRLHLPWLHVLSAELDGGAHALELRLPEEPAGEGRGRAVRIRAFVVNGAETK